VIETFGIFVGIFAVVVVIVLGVGDAVITNGVSFDTQLLILVGIPAALTIVILVLLPSIKWLILMPPQN
jgi:hypothetical protein